MLSHSDADHLGVVDQICTSYKVKRVIRSGYERDTQTWKDADAAIRLEKQNEGCVDINSSMAFAGTLHKTRAIAHAIIANLMG